jgi:hypothetical protein
MGLTPCGFSEISCDFRINIPEGLEGMREQNTAE